MTCEKCPFGQYQDLQGQEECKHCPNGTWTYIEGVTSADMCYGECEFIPELNLYILAV